MFNKDRVKSDDVVTFNESAQTADIQEEVSQEPADNGKEQDKGNWSMVRYKRKNVDLDDYEIWIPKKWGFSSKEEGFWRCAKYTYGSKQNNYNHRPGDWSCFYCNNINFTWRRLCNDCGVPKDRGTGRGFSSLN